MPIEKNFEVLLSNKQQYSVQFLNFDGVLILQNYLLIKKLKVFLSVQCRVLIQAIFKCYSWFYSSSKEFTNLSIFLDFN